MAGVASSGLPELPGWSCPRRARPVPGRGKGNRGLLIQGGDPILFLLFLVFIDPPAQPWGGLGSSEGSELGARHRVLFPLPLIGQPDGDLGKQSPNAFFCSPGFLQD